MVILWNESNRLINKRQNILTVIKFNYCFFRSQLEVDISIKGEFFMFILGYDRTPKRTRTLKMCKYFFFLFQCKSRKFRMDMAALLLQHQEARFLPSCNSAILNKYTYGQNGSSSSNQHRRKKNEVKEKHINSMELF